MKECSKGDVGHMLKYINTQVRDGQRDGQTVDGVMVTM